MQYNITSHVLQPLDGWEELTGATCLLRITPGVRDPGVYEVLYFGEGIASRESAGTAPAYRRVREDFSSPYGTSRPVDDIFVRIYHPVALLSYYNNTTLQTWLSMVCENFFEIIFNALPCSRCTQRVSLYPIFSVMSSHFMY